MESHNWRYEWYRLTAETKPDEEELVWFCYEPKQTNSVRFLAKRTSEGWRIYSPPIVLFLDRPIYWTHVHPTLTI